MARDDLNLKIRALVEGVQEVQQLTKEVDELQKEAGQTVPDSTRKFRRGLGKTQKAARSANSVMGNLRGTITAVAGALGAGALGGKLLRTANEMEQVNRQAQALGTTVQTMSELAFTFRQFGLQQDDVSDALGTLSDRAEDAQAGMKSFIEDFQLLGVEVDDLRGKRPGELLDLVAERVSGIEDPTRRAAGVVRIFGDDLGRRLLPLLLEGADGLERHAEKAREVGAAYDEEAARAGAEAARTFRELRETIDAQFTQAVANNADELERTARAFTSIFIEGTKAASALVEYGQSLQFSGDEANLFKAETLKGTNSELERLRDLLDQIENSRAGDALGDPEQVRQQIRILEARRELLRKQQEDDNGGGSDADTGDAGDTGGDTQDEIDIPDRTDPASLGAGTGSSPAAATGGMATLDADFQQQLREGKKLFEELRTASERYNATIAEYDRLLEAGSISQETYNRAVARAKEELKAAGDQAGQTGKEMSEFARQAKSNIQDQLGNTLFQGLKNDFDGIEDAWRDMLYRMLAEATAAQLSESLFGTGEGFGGGAVGSIIGALGSSGGGSLGTGTGSSPAAASGGSNNGWVASLFQAFASFHDGGVVGQGGRMGLAPVSVWNNAPRMHSGGVAGLRRDEVPIIAKRGEEVLTADNPRHRDNAGAPQVNMRNVNVIRERDIAEAMSGPDGEEVILNIIRRNPEIS